MLHSERGYKALADIGVDVWPKWYEGDTISHDDMCKNIDIFLERLDRNFIEITLTKDHPFNGSYMCVDWYKPDEGMDSWDPRTGGIMTLNHFMVESMAKARDGTSTNHQDASLVFYFHLGLTIVHELVHCFMNFLSGDEENDTPTEIVDIQFTKGSSNRPWGDSDRPSSTSRGVFLIISREPSLGPGWLSIHEDWLSFHEDWLSFHEDWLPFYEGWFPSRFVSRRASYACVCYAPDRPSSTSRRVFIIVSREAFPREGWLPFHQGWFRSLFVSRRASHARICYPPDRPSSTSHRAFGISRQALPSAGWFLFHKGWLPFHEGWSPSRFVSRRASHACVCYAPDRFSSTPRRVFLIISREDSPGEEWLSFHEGWHPFCEGWCPFCKCRFPSCGVFKFRRKFCPYPP
ncbi:hypothetical protein C8A01DRAFT_32186 [Parachaetomium inaequale]|uniref:Uncharacterized protein n=1 Tax=Parachaetomium inaequale TaxID=2588326 RepID=A0AAN6SVJ9_9PEZI|nr:hypothetical protein C8A01DRAFT_32186 [Parachaetomium inaequale]